MDPLKMHFLWNLGIFHCYVSLPEDNIHYKKPWDFKPSWIIRWDSVSWKIRWVFFFKKNGKFGQLWEFSHVWTVQAIEEAPRAERYTWQLGVRVGSQSISPLYWALQTGRWWDMWHVAWGEKKRWILLKGCTLATIRQKQTCHMSHMCLFYVLSVLLNVLVNHVCTNQNYAIRYFLIFYIVFVRKSTSSLEVEVDYRMVVGHRDCWFGIRV